jgi:hypothetical protein
MIPSSINDKESLIPYLTLLGFEVSYDEKLRLSIYTKIGYKKYAVIFYKLEDRDYIYFNLYNQVNEEGVTEFKYSESNNLYGFSDIISYLNTEFNHELRKIK